MESKDILLNGMFRSANTYLTFAFTEAININGPEGSMHDFNTRYHLHNHTHSATLLKLDDPENETIHFCIFRNPEQLIPSLFMFHYSDEDVKDLINDEFIRKIRNACAEYNKYLKNQLKYGYATVILFDDIVNDIHTVLDKILKSVELEYINKIDIEKVKSDLLKIDEERYKDPENFYRNYHLPREEKYPDLKKRVLTTFKKMKEFDILMNQYLEIEKRAKELTPLTISN
jgi:hypothetical protein